MKLWEVIKELTEDPTKTFEAELKSLRRTACMSVDIGFSRYFKFEVLDGERRVVLSGGGAFNNNVALDLDWQLVRQPVTWQEALQAWADGKTIRLKMPEWEQVWKPTNAIGFNHCQINLGTWYVED